MRQTKSGVEKLVVDDLRLWVLRMFLVIIPISFTKKSAVVKVKSIFKQRGGVHKGLPL